MENTKKRWNISPSLKILIGFLALILLGAFLLCLPIVNSDGQWLKFSSALFTSTSAVCVTGMAVVDISMQFNIGGQIIILILIQIGGLGVVAITSLLALLMGKKINLSGRLTLQESLNKDSIEGVVATLKKILLLTLSIEFVGALCLLYSTINITGSVGHGIFTAIFLSVSAFCNAGIDILGVYGGEFSSLTAFAGNTLLLLPIAMLVILGSLGFIVLFNAFKPLKGKQHIKVVLLSTIILLLGGTVAFLALEWNNPNTLGNLSVMDKIVNAFFQSTTLRTAGFATISQSSLTTGGQILSIILMLIGGSPNSTAGGLKTTTVLILLLFLFSKPNEKGDITFRQRRISSKIVRKAIKIFLSQLCVLMLSILLITIVDGDIGVSAIVYECVSAITTTGVGMGVTRALTTFSKTILCALMFVGRVGLITIGIAVTQSPTSADFEYQNTDIIVG